MTLTGSGQKEVQKVKNISDNTLSVMFPKPLISAHGPNEFELGLFCNTYGVYQENISESFKKPKGSKL